MPTLAKATVAEIERELKRRREEEAKREIPQPLPVINTKAMVEFALSVRDSIVDGTYHEDNDNDHWAYEVVMETVFGKAYWEWHNKKVE